MTNSTWLLAQATCALLLGLSFPALAYSEETINRE
jgi:hypothetical protein